MADAAARPRVGLPAFGITAAILISSMIADVVEASGPGALRVVVGPRKPLGPPSPGPRLREAGPRPSPG